MDIPVELVFFLILIVANAIAGLFKGQKKKGPTGTSLPPAERKRPAARPERPTRAPRSAGPTSRPESRAPEATGRRYSPREDPAWWDSDAPTPTAPQPAPSGDKPWWESDATEATEPPSIQDPEELWAILTGETLSTPTSRPPPPPLPEPAAPLPVPYEGAEARAPRPAPIGDDLSGDDWVVSLEGESLEATEISSEARHEAFHEKIDRRAPVARRIAALDRIGLADPSDVRRAVVMAEILGRPRSLSGPDW
jgi:hypothetical protein